MTEEKTANEEMAFLTISDTTDDRPILFASITSRVLTHESTEPDLQKILRRFAGSLVKLIATKTEKKQYFRYEFTMNGRVVFSDWLMRHPKITKPE